MDPDSIFANRVSWIIGDDRRHLVLGRPEPYPMKTGKRLESVR